MGNVVINWSARNIGRGESWVGKGKCSEHIEFQLPLEQVGGNA